MSERATATIEGADWKDEPFAPSDDGPNLSGPRGVDRYHGEIEATATWAGLLISGPDGDGAFMSAQRVVGSVAGRSGSFVMIVNGSVDSGTTTATCLLHPGSGTGQLTGIAGEGGLVYGEDEASLWLDYSLRSDEPLTAAPADQGRSSRLP